MKNGMCFQVNNNGQNPSQYNDLIGDILKKHTDDGGMDNLEGAGKPLSKEYFSGDTFQHFQRVAKDAGYKPYWIKLQHEIRNEIIAIIDSERMTKGKQLRRIEQINEKIVEYNKSCPPPLQKGLVSLDNIEFAIDRW